VAYAPAPEAESFGSPFEEASFDPRPGGFAPEPVEAVIAATTAPAPAVHAPVAWWDEEPPIGDGAPADPVATGRFALGGFAMQAGQQALGGVSFRAGIAAAPAAWAVGPVASPSAGTLVLTLDGAINCAPEDLEVVTEPGFAPTSEGFTVRVSAAAPGPFAASGTFRLH
jgi:hypothetical protein